MYALSQTKNGKKKKTLFSGLTNHKNANISPGLLLVCSKHVLRRFLRGGRAFEVAYDWSEFCVLNCVEGNNKNSLKYKANP